MVVTTIRQKDFLGNTGVFKDVQYFGNSVFESTLEDNIKRVFKYYQGASCEAGGNKGIIIGFEDSESFNDYYWIVYIPDNRNLEFVLYNDSDFYKSIKI